MKLYNELAGWWHLLSSPEDYAEEAGLYWNIISKYKTGIINALELGSGGGNNAFYLKQKCKFTLTDLSPEMIKVSQQLNPECDHYIGDMRSINLNQTFDLVFIHDAIMYMTTEADLLQVFNNAHKHLNPDGILFIVPDFFNETFSSKTSHGGHDGDHKSIRYLEWTYDKDPDDTIVETEYVYLLKDKDDKVTCVHDSTKEGIFAKVTWERLLTKAGFDVIFEPIAHSELEPESYYGIVGRKQ